MNRYENLHARFSGVALIVAPLLLFFASVIKAAGIGSSTDRWYDSWVESVVTFLGMSLLIIALLALSRIVGSKQPVLGTICAIFSILGTSATFFPTAIRYIGAQALAAGISIDQLDILFGGTDAGPPNLIAPFLLLFFLNLILLSFGLWRIKDIPRYSSVLLPTGAVLFMVAQSPFDIIVIAYVASTVAWLLAMAPIGIRLLGDEGIVAVAYA